VPDIEIGQKETFLKASIGESIPFCIWKDLDELSGIDTGLDFPPKRHIEQLTVVGNKNFSQTSL
jgi:hypothetical protein